MKKIFLKIIKFNFIKYILKNFVKYKNQVLIYYFKY